MNITNLGQNLPIMPLKIGQKPESSTITTNQNTEISNQKIDMRNISINEINDLIKSGVDGLLDILPMPFFGVDNSYNESFMNQKFDFLGQVENSIKFEKDLGQPTDFLEKILANLNKISGTNFISKVDIIT